MNSCELVHTENIARLLKPVWYNEGVIAYDAFTLRSKLHEAYISVLREALPTFHQDAMNIVRGRKNSVYASINVGELSEREDVTENNVVSYSVKEVDNAQLPSHAGIYIAINGHNIVGGEPFGTFLRQKGVADEAILVEIGYKLAMMAQKNIKVLSI